jgi:hypothetical protein
MSIGADATSAISRTCPWIGGDESEFDGIRGLVGDGNDEAHEFLHRHECLVDRTGVGRKSRLSGGLTDEPVAEVVQCSEPTPKKRQSTTYRTAESHSRTSTA